MDIEKIATGLATGVVSGAGTAYIAVRSWVARTERKLDAVDRLELDVAGLQHDIRTVTARQAESEARNTDRYEELREDIRDVGRKLDRLIERSGEKG